MKKLSNIVESIWSDMQDRGTGDIVKKEDDLDLMDFREFCTFIKDHYKSKFYYVGHCTHSFSDGRENEDCIDIDVIPVPKSRPFEVSPLSLSYNPTHGYVEISHKFGVEMTDRFFNDFKNRFKINKNSGSFNTWITDKNGNCSNNTFVAAINLFLEHMPEYYRTTEYYQ